jgi:DNA-directed RNA polymerase subunit RPC12/RpoP
MQSKHLKSDSIETIYVCSRCGRQAPAAQAFGNWLIARRRGKQSLIIRCPDCKTKYAVRTAER